MIHVSDSPQAQGGESRILYYAELYHGTGPSNNRRAGLYFDVPRDWVDTHVDLCKDMEEAAMRHYRERAAGISVTLSDDHVAHIYMFKRLDPLA